MPGMFDDLIPSAKGAANAGMFDDLIPKETRKNPYASDRTVYDPVSGAPIGESDPVENDLRAGLAMSDEKRTKYQGRVLDANIPGLTPLSAAQDIGSGVLQIGPTAVKGVADIARLATGDRVGTDTSHAMARGIKSIQEKVGSERAQMQAKRFAQDMADPALNAADVIVGNPGALADQVLPTVGSMALPAGVGAAAARAASAGNAAKLAGAIDAATLADRVNKAREAAVIGTTIAQNAGDTFGEIRDSGGALNQAYTGAAITAPFTYVAGRLTGGGAENVAAKLLAGQSVRAGVSQIPKAMGKEAAQEMGEQVGQSVGETVGKGEDFNLNKIGKEVAVAGVLGGVMGGGVTGIGHVHERYAEQAKNIGVSERAVRAAIAKSEGLPEEQRPGFLERVTQSLAKRGLVKDYTPGTVENELSTPEQREFTYLQKQLQDPAVPESVKAFAQQRLEELTRAQDVSSASEVPAVAPEAGGLGVSQPAGSVGAGAGRVDGAVPAMESGLPGAVLENGSVRVGASDDAVSGYNAALEDLASLKEDLKTARGEYRAQIVEQIGIIESRLPELQAAMVQPLPVSAESAQTIANEPVVQQAQEAEPITSKQVPTEAPIQTEQSDFPAITDYQQASDSDRAAYDAATGAEPSIANQEQAANIPADANTANMAELDQAAHAAATSPLNDIAQPTDGQKKAGNYAKGHVSINGLDLSIENPAGSTRSGVDAKGNSWENTLAHHYGYIKGTIGNDKDHVDAFVKPGTPLDYSGQVFVVNQNNPDTGKFDEHKAMIGFDDQAQAETAYRQNYAQDWKGLHSIAPMSFDEFKAWVKDGAKTAPVKNDATEVQADAKAEREAISAVNALTDAEFFEVDDVMFDAPSNVSTDVAMRALGFTEKEIENAIAKEQGIKRQDRQSSSGAVETASVKAQGDSGQRTPETRAGKENGQQVTVEPRANGTLAVKGDPKAVREKLTAAGIPTKSMMPMDGGILVGKTQAEKAKAIFEPLLSSPTKADIEAKQDREANAETQTPTTGKVVSTFIGKFKNGMGEFAAKQEAARLNKLDDGASYSAEEHGDPKLSNPWAVVGRERTVAASTKAIAQQGQQGPQYGDKFTVDLGSVFGNVPYRASAPVAAPEGGEVLSSRIIVKKTPIKKDDRQDFGDQKNVFAWRVSAIKNKDGSIFSKVEAMTQDHGRTPDGEVVGYFTDVRGHALDALGRIAPSISRAAQQAYDDAVSRNSNGDFLDADVPTNPGKSNTSAERVQETTKSEQVEKQEPAVPASAEGFYADKEPMVRARAESILSKRTSDESGEVMTRAEWVKKQIDAGAKLETVMVDKIKPMSRMQDFRATNEEQRAHRAKVEAAGKVPEYSIGDYGVTKTEYDYAQYLIGQKASSQAPVADKPPAEAASAPEPKTLVQQEKELQTKIADFGEKIGGARKDVWTGFKDRLIEIGDADVASKKLSEVWPHPDYQALIDGGMNKEAIALIRAMRDEIPAKPRTSYKVTRWAKQVIALRNFARQLMDGDFTPAQVREKAADGSSAMLGMLGRADLYAELGHEKSLEGIRLAHHRYTFYRGRENVSLWAVERDARATAFGNWPQELAIGDTKADAIAAFKARYNSIGAEAPKSTSFDIFSEHGKNGYFIGKKIGRNMATLAGPFATVKEARAHREANIADLENALAKYKEIPRERRDVNEPRVGEDMRNGQDVTPEFFAETFGFRGVEFGNWVEQKRRQKDLNDAFDGLMDMAAILNIPAKAISLNGQLGLAFGARGGGGINPAAAHYEPGKVVINLTKMNGAGSLGHEWWHALDNYFAKPRNKGEYMTTALDVGLASRGAKYQAYPGIRPEMIEAYGAVVRAVNKTAMKERSKKLDAKRSKEYWGTGEELTARAFEAYLISKLQDQNASNDYLANIVDEKMWNAAAALGMENENSYPYPTESEIPSIRAGFDQFFQTVQTKETDKGVAMFKRDSQTIPTGGMPLDNAQRVVDDLTKNWKDGPPVHVVDFVSELPVHAPMDTRGLYRNGEVWIVASANKNRTEIGTTLAHEAIAHYGLKNMLGEDWDKFMGLVQLAIKSGNKPLKSIQEQVRKNYVDGKGRFNLTPNQEADEIAAKVVEQAVDENGEFKPGFGFVKSVYAKIVQFLRSIGLNITLTHAELQGALVNANKLMERGRTEFAPDFAGVAASRGKTEGMTNKDVVGNQGGRSADDSTPGVTLYHGSPESGLTAVHDKPSSFFGGVFASPTKRSARSHGENVYETELPEASILRQRTLDNDISRDDIEAALKKAMPRLGDDDLEAAYKAVIDDQASRVDGDEMMRIFKEEDVGAASWEAQRIRGLVAKQLGFKAVEMDDEHGTSYLLLPGVKLSEQNEPTAPGSGGAGQDAAKFARMQPQDEKAQHASEFSDDISEAGLRAIGMLEHGVGRGADSVHPYVARSLQRNGPLRLVAEAIGGRIQWFDLRDDLGAEMRRKFGFFNGAHLNGTIFLRTSGHDRPHLATLGHELSHRMRRERPDLYAELVDAVAQFVDVARYESEFKNSPVAKDVHTEEGKQEEFIGEVLSDGFMDKGFWLAVGKHDKGLLQELVGMIGKLIDAIKAKVGYSQKSAKYLTDFDRVMEIAGEAMAKYAVAPKAANPEDSMRFMGKDTIEVDGVERPTTNSKGQPLAATEDGVRNFWRWFKDSRIVDADGRPLVVYHGTNEQFNAFDPDRPFEGGFFFTDQEGHASKFGDNLMACYLSIKNPYVVDGDTLPVDHEAEDIEQVTRSAKDDGRDGVLITDFRDIGSVSDTFIAFRPEQIKSATGNNGSFSPDTSDIRFARGDFANKTVEKIGELAASDLFAGKTSHWHKSVGTMFNLAQRSPAFKKVFDAVQSLINDTSYYATEAANMAPSLLPKLETWRDINKKAITSDDAKAIKAPIFEGTLSWVRDKSGKPVRVADVEAKAANMATEDKVDALLEAKQISKTLLKMWRGHEQEKFDSLIESRYKNTMLRPGVVFSDSELKSLFSLNERQIGLYHEFRNAVDTSIDNLTLASMVRVGGKDAADIRQKILSAASVDAAEAALVKHLTGIMQAHPEYKLAAETKAKNDEEAAKIEDLAKSDIEAAEEIEDKVTKRIILERAAKDIAKAKRLRQNGDYAIEKSGRTEEITRTIELIQDLADRAAKLKREGYAPLSRFGSYTVSVYQDGELEYFGMYESVIERARAMHKLRKNFPNAEFKQGTMSQEQQKLYQGITPDTAALFGDILGLDATGDSAADKAFQLYLKNSVANQSAMKRMIHRKGIAGFNEDAGRVLAAFVYSNARQTAKTLHTQSMLTAADEIPSSQGELKDAAIKLVDYVRNPQEEAQVFRSILFAQYIGGSVASAMVNMTQPMMMTFPYLSQFGGVKKAAATMARATKLAVSKKIDDKNLAAALKRAEEDGAVSPQEVHQLMQQASGGGVLKSGDGTLAGNSLAKAQNGYSRVLHAWGVPFSLAEQLNRRITFIAAYQTATEQGMDNPDAFARTAISETQGLYNKGNKPRWARGVVGSVLFTFKQYSVAYVEMLHRMATAGKPGSPERAAGRKAALTALAVLWLMSGLGGLPGADDLDDVISGLLQTMGYNVHGKFALKEFFAKFIGNAGAEFMMSGVTGIPGAPLDVSGRLGLGNLIPGTGYFQKKKDHTQDLKELGGAAGDFIGRAFDAAAKAMQLDFMGKDGAVATAAPKAAQNMIQAADMAKTDSYRDKSNNKVITTTTTDAAVKFVGFQPQNVKRAQDSAREIVRMSELNRLKESEIVNKWANARFEGDDAGVEAARAELRDWNEKNPETPIRITMAQIAHKLRDMRMTKEQRIEKTAPKELRRRVREMSARDE